MSFKIHIPHIHISSPANFPGPPSVNLEIKGDLSFLRNDDEVSLGYNLHWLTGDVLITGIVKNKVAVLPGAVQEADPMAILEQLIKKGQQKSEKTPKNEKTSKQLLGEFYSDKKHLESLLEDKGTVLLGASSFFCINFDSETLAVRLPSLPLCSSDPGDNKKWGAIEGCHPGLPSKPHLVH